MALIRRSLSDGGHAHMHSFTVDYSITTTSRTPRGVRCRGGFGLEGLSCKALHPSPRIEFPDAGYLTRSAHSPLKA